MAKPTVVPLWATDANVTSGFEAGSTVREDPAAAAGQGWIAGAAAPARWANWVQGLAGDWCAYLDNLHGETEFLNKNYTWTGDHSWSSAATFSVNCLATFDNDAVVNGWATFHSRLVANGLVQVNNNTECTGYIQCAGAVFSDTNINSNGEYLYGSGPLSPSPKTRTLYINLMACTGGGGAAPTDGVWSCPAGSNVYIPLQLPSGAVVTSMTFRTSQNTGGVAAPGSFLVKQRSGTSAATTVLTYVTPAQANNTPTTSPPQALTLNILNTGGWAWVEYNSAVNTSFVLGITVTFSDPGPRNF